MADISKVSGVAAADIDSVAGVGAANISKVSGVTKSAGAATATKWLVGATNGKVFKSAVANAGSGWAELVDLGGGNGKSITIGQDSLGNKRWVLHRTSNTEEIAYVTDGLEGTAGNWTEVNLSNNHLSVDGGPNVAWGNDYWIGAGDDVAVSPAPSDEDVLFVSSDGGTNWSTVQLSAQQTNDTGRTACYKDGTTFFFTIQDQIWKATADPTDANNWSNVIDLAGTQDIYCMAYDGSSRWVCGGASGEVHTSDDDWDSATSRTGGHGTSTISGVVYCGGTVNKWVTVGASGKVAYSTDGETWTAVSPNPTSFHLRAVATDDTTIVAVGQSGCVLTSTDAINWTVVTHSPSINYQFWSVACDIIGAGMR